MDGVWGQLRWSLRRLDSMMQQKAWENGRRHRVMDSERASSLQITADERPRKRTPGSRGDSRQCVESYKMPGTQVLYEEGTQEPATKQVHSSNYLRLTWLHPEGLLDSSTTMRCERTLEEAEKAIHRMIQPGEVGGEQEGAKKAIEQVTQPGEVGDDEGSYRPVPPSSNRIANRSLWSNRPPPRAHGSRTVAP